MGFLNSISTVVKHGKDLTKYEQDNNNKQEQRKAYFKLHPVSQDELELAKKRGKAVMDVIDDMDQHSEDVAENVEEYVSAPLEAAGPFLGLLGGGLLSWFTSFKKMSNSYKNLMSYNSEASKKMSNFLYENYDDVKKHVKINAFDNFASSFIGNSHKIKKISKVATDSTLKNKAAELFKTVSKDHNNVKRFGGLGVAIIGAGALAGFIGGILSGTALQVKSSRIARWQSREKLNDPKYFVQYTDEQVEQAKQNLAAQEDKKGFSIKGLFGKKDKKDSTSLIKVLKDNKKYKEWKKNDKDDSKKVQGELSKEDLIVAEQDKEYLQRITREINNRAEDYSENMEVLADVFIAGSPLLGWAVGTPIAWLSEKTNFIQKIFNKRYGKLVASSGGEAKNALETATKSLGAMNKNSGLLNNARNLANGLNGISQFLENNSKKLKDVADVDLRKKLGNGILDTLAVFSKFKGGRSGMIKAITVPAIGFAGLILGLKLQKSSARAGRFIAKREIENDPTNFIGLTDEQLKEVSHVSAKKESFGTKFKNYVTFLPRLIKEYFDYSKYMKTEAKQNKKLLKELTKLEVTDKQLKDAKNLQRKMFNTFEKVDEGSQQYSESMEAATTMLQPIIEYAPFITAIGIPAIGLGVAAKKGKLNLVDIVNSVTGFLAKHTKSLKGKKVSNYADAVSAKISNVTKGIVLDADETKLSELVYKITKNTKEATIQDLIDVLDNKALRREINKMLQSKSNAMKFTDDYANFNTSFSINEIKDIVANICPDKNLKLSEAGFSEILKAYNLEFIDDFIKGGDFNTILNGAKQYASKTLDIAKDASSKEFSKMYQALKNTLKTAKPDEWKSILQDMPICGNKLTEILTKYGKDNLTSSKLVSIMDNFEKIMSNLPKEQSKKIMDTAMQLIQEDPVRFAKAIGNKAQLIDMFRTKGVSIAMVTIPAAWGGLNYALAFMVESALASTQKKAGRLGVMKGLESLEDNRYYANSNNDEVKANKKETEVKNA